MGQILYNGPYDPQYHEPTTPPYENFTVQVPSSASAGTALIGVAHVTLIGVCCQLYSLSPLALTLSSVSQAGYFPYLEVLNTTLTVS